MSVHYKNITVKAVEDEPGHALVFYGNKKIGLVEGDAFSVSFDVFCYETSNDSRFTDAAHFIWTLLNSDDWAEIRGIMGDPVTQQMRTEWQKNWLQKLSLI